MFPALRDKGSGEGVRGVSGLGRVEWGATGVFWDGRTPNDKLVVNRACTAGQRRDLVDRRALVLVEGESPVS